MKKVLLLVCLLVCNLIFAAENSEYDLEVSRRAQLAMSNPDYMVSPGDVYSLSYSAGGGLVTFSIPIDSSYKIRISNLGILDATGKSYLELKKQVESVVNKNYPLSPVQFVLLKPAIYKVLVKGEVTATIEKEIWAFTRLSSVIDGLKTPYSSERNIEVIDKNGTKKVYDLFKAFRYGDLKANPYIHSGDTIIVNRAGRKVSIFGAVEREGTYELLPNENLQELINIYANGLTKKADTSKIEITKINEGEELAGTKKYIGQKEIDKNYVLENYDSVYISSFYELKPYIFVEGCVRNNQDNTTLVSSNRYAVSFTVDEKYDSFIRKHRAYFGETSDLENAYIKRNEEVIKINIENILYDYNFVFDLKIQEMDQLIIPFKQAFVTVSGAVLKPGRYPYIPDRNWEYYINLAGGFNKNQNSFNSIKIKNKDNKVISKNDKIDPETIIMAETNSFTYYFNTYAPVITTCLSILSTVFTVVMINN